MNNTSAQKFFRVESLDSDSAPADTFHWLLILGFPLTVAAALVAPELFRADDGGFVDRPLFRRA